MAKSTKINSLISVLAMLFQATYSIAADYNKKEQMWQWQTEIELISPKDQSKYTASPFLWIPPKCEKVKAVMVMSTAVIEQAMVESPYIRKVCADNDIAIMWSGHQFYRGNESAKQQIEAMLFSFAEKSGYKELTAVPWIPCGHSGTNPMVRYITMNAPEKVAFTIIHKATAQVGNTNSVPILSTQGEFMEWSSYDRDLTQNINEEKSYTDVIRNREKSAMPLSYYFDPNTGHFDCSDRLLKNIALWIEDICQLRFDEKGAIRAINLQDGWITSLPVPGYLGKKSLPVKVVKADQTMVEHSPWYPSKRTALAAYEMANQDMTREAQIAGFADFDNQIDDVSYWWRGIARIPYIQEGAYFKLNVIPYTRMPKGKYLIARRNPETQRDMEVLEGVFYNHKEHTFTNSGNDIDIEIVSGNFVKTDWKNTFKYVPRFKTANYFVARQKGNKKYRNSVQVGRIDLINCNKGEVNTISFDGIQNQRIGSLKAIELKAESSAGEPVEFFVNYGPAYIKDNRLYIRVEDIPVKSKYPIEIKVTAYSLGNANEEHPVKTATPVSKVFYLHRL
ncbi:hypothetical protein [Bacteroides finegoldii]|uniref:hypothetical protein n=1 Tax=Bacteroides finegoldii TaxID=338188 RepID=UPI00189EFFB9|nr:hypothetical protein [Bacteroides finegoldii]